MHVITHDMGLILKTSSLKERDGIIVIATFSHGIIHGLSTGFGQPQSKLRAHLQPGNVCEVSWVTGLSGIRLVAAVATYAPKGVSRKYLLGFGRYLMKFVVAQHPDEHVSAVIKAAIQVAPSVTKEDYIYEEAKIIYSLLHVLGYVPQIEPSTKELPTMIKHISRAVHASHL